jgi:hypothetical protein
MGNMLDQVAEVFHVKHLGEEDKARVLLLQIAEGRPVPIDNPDFVGRRWGVEDAKPFELKLAKGDE